MGSHLIDGEFQSDKYPTCPRGKVPLSVKDPKPRAVSDEASSEEASSDEASCEGCGCTDMCAPGCTENVAAHERYMSNGKRVMWAPKPEPTS